MLNNTHFILSVNQDDKWLARLQPGQQVALSENWLVPKTVVAVTAYAPGEVYIGAESWTFLSNTPEIWQVNEVRRPQPSR